MKKIITILIIGLILLGNAVFATTINIPGDYSTIQAGIDAASNGDTVLVQPDTYVENIDYNGKSIVVGSLFMTTSDTSYIASTIIDGNQNGSVVSFQNSEDSTSVLSGFTITNGSGTSLGSSTYGGGVYCWYTSPSLNNLTVMNCSASSSGGGIICFYSNSNLENVTIANNSAADGGGIYCGYSSPSLKNVTITGNSASSYGGGIYCSSSDPTLVNCIIWNDSPQEIFVLSGTTTVTYSDIQGGWTGIGNIDANPLFCNPNSGDFTLSEDSPCVGTGEGGANMGALGVGCGTIILEPVIAAIADSTINEDGQLLLTISAESQMGYAMSFSAASDTADVIAGVSNDTLTLTPAAHWHGSALITVVVTDENSLSDTTSFVLTVTPVNDAPIITAIDSITIDEDSSAAVNLSAMDVEEDTLAFSISADTSVITTNVDGTNLTLTPEANWNGLADITVIVTDGSLSDTTSFVLSVTPVNDAPFFTMVFDDTVGAGDSITIMIQADDIDSQDLTYSVSGQPEWLVLNGNVLSGYSSVGGLFIFEIGVSDGALSTTGDYYLMVEQVRPVITEINDVPDDQGGRVYINFHRSSFDIDSLNGIGGYQGERMDDVGWVGVGTCNGSGADNYIIEVNTLVDSSSSTDGMTVFRVIANMEEGNFASTPASGYSIDNIAPAAPTGLLAVVIDESIELSWNVSPDDDFHYFILEKSTDSEFDDYETIETIDTTYTDTECEINLTYYYHLAAVDYTGNLSEYSGIVESTIIVAPVIADIPDITINEDEQLVLNLSVESPLGYPMTFSATADTSAVIVAVSTDTLSVSLVDNWNGNSIIMVVVTDENNLSDTTSFELTVNAVNDAPSSFALSEQDSVYITMANFDSDSIVFTWDESADVEDDELSYHFTAELVINNQLTTEYDTTLTANAMKIDYKSVFDEIYAAQSMLAAIEWDVSVSDGVEEVMAENGPLTVGVNASDAVLSIDEELLPDKFALHQNYPNPFNPVTTLRYDLPENSLVNIIIYDLLGRQVKTLVNQTQEAGYKSVLWNATNNYGKPVSAGVYLYQIQAGEFVQTKKMVLLK